MRILGLKPMSTWDRMESIMKIMGDNSSLRKRAEITPVISNKRVSDSVLVKGFNKIG